MKHVELRLLNSLSIHPYYHLDSDKGYESHHNIEIREFVDDEWIKSCYTTYDNLVEKVKEILEDE
tara:strand:+ start:2050 stop:2244 length:195 start_codon:yes stop_codon:yes gene_type:complete